MHNISIAILQFLMTNRFMQTWRKRTAEKAEEEQVKQLRAAMTHLMLLDLLVLIDRWAIIYCT